MCDSCAGGHHAGSTGAGGMGFGDEAGGGTLGLGLLRRGNGVRRDLRTLALSGAWVVVVVAASVRHACCGSGLYRESVMVETS